MVGLLSLGKSDFEATVTFREDRCFKEYIGLSKISGSFASITAPTCAA